MTAAEARSRGDATDEQRRELRRLIATKAVPDDWVQRFYRDVRAAGGLSRGAANAALIYLRRLADKKDQPTYATPEQGTELRGLVRTRLVPGALAQTWLTRLDAGRLTYPEAARAVADCRRLPLRAFIAPDGPHRGDPGTDALDGCYALAGADGRTRRYRVHTLTRTGQRLVDQITGDNRSQRRRLRGAQATQVLRAISADTAAAARLYGATFKRCSDCNQPLRDETQPGYPHGYGWACWEARQAAAQPETASQEP